MLKYKYVFALFSMVLALIMFTVYRKDIVLQLIRSFARTYFHNEYIICNVTLLDLRMHTLFVFLFVCFFVFLFVCFFFVFFCFFFCELETELKLIRFAEF